MSQYLVIIDEAEPAVGEASDDAGTGSFEQFFVARYPWARRGAYLLTYSHSAAEDIAQDAFVEVMRRWDDIDAPEAYLWRTVTNRSRTWMRKTRRQGRWPTDGAASVPAAKIHIPLDGEAIAVRDALAELPRAQREAIVLRYYAGFREREIAAATGASIGTVKSRIHRGIAALKAAIGPTPEEPSR